jgi:indolepyruvate ferredoxin oxidoreductase
VVSAGAKTLGLMTTGLRRGGQQPRDRHRRFHPQHRVPHPRRGPGTGAAGAAQEGLSLFDASELSRKLLGDTIFTNQMLLGAAWQRGLIPLSREAILQAVELNGAAVERNKQAFEMGRWAIVNPEAAERLIAAEVVAKPKTLEEKIAFREGHLTAYQGKRLARRYRKLVDAVTDPRLKEAVAKGYHKLLSLQGRIRGRAPAPGQPKPRRGRPSTAISG